METKKKYKVGMNPNSRNELKEVGYRVIRLWESDIKTLEINNFNNLINVIQ